MADSARSVLVVEDDPLILESTSSLLADDGCAVTRASSCEEATACLERGPIPDCVVTDIMLGGQSAGLELARTVAERWPQVRLILVSGAHRATPEEYPEQALFFTKPYADGALLTMIKTPDWQR
jgi:CheY-like chemotaxis protein